MDPLEPNQEEGNLMIGEAIETPVPTNTKTKTKDIVMREEEVNKEK